MIITNETTSKIGTNSQGHYLELVDGSRVNITRTEYFQILFTEDVEAVLSPADDLPHDLDDRADWQAAAANGYSFS